MKNVYTKIRNPAFCLKSVVIHRNPAKSAEIHRNPSKSTEIHRIPPKSVEITEIHRYEIRRNPSKSIVDFGRIRRISADFDGFWRISEDFGRISVDFGGFR
jgi:hypothetical protein